MEVGLHLASVNTFLTVVRFPMNKSISEHLRGRAPQGPFNNVGYPRMGTCVKAHPAVRFLMLEWYSVSASFSSLSLLSLSLPLITCSHPCRPARIVV
jgi:hypothetical protein